MSSAPAGSVRAIDHVGFVVTEIEPAVRFFVDVLGFEEIDRRGELEEADGDRMTRLFGVHPRATGQFRFLQLGSMRVELLQWSAPDQRTDVPRNADVGGRHLALSVGEIDSFLARVSAEPGVVVRERNDRGFYYVSTPFGLEIQLIPA
jgi:catechol 2,3-dioxygenase-like lactoylglutathione lyase family enzyme